MSDNRTDSVPDGGEADLMEQAMLSLRLGLQELPVPKASPALQSQVLQRLTSGQDLSPWPQQVLLRIRWMLLPALIGSLLTVVLVQIHPLLSPSLLLPEMRARIMTLPIPLQTQTKHPNGWLGTPGPHGMEVSTPPKPPAALPGDTTTPNPVQPSNGSANNRHAPIHKHPISIHFRMEKRLSDENAKRNTVSLHR